MRQTGWRRAVKQVLDRTVATAALVAAGPVLLVTAAAVRSALGSPVLFRQRRPGYRGEPFELLKFRTMTDARDEAGQLLPDSVRLTAFGRFLRSTSLDELPQLINIARGDMSLVGPRPLLMQYLKRYSPDQARRHDVLPGLTGWAQVNGRNAVSWPEKFALDTWYVDHWSLALDLKIVLMTVARVLERSDISSQGHHTMPEFQGEQSR